MNIKTITCHDVYNFGASLQAYALQSFITSLGHDVEIINYKPDYLSHHYKLLYVDNPAYRKNIVTKLVYVIYKLPCKLYQQRRKKNFDCFTRSYLRIGERYNSFLDLKEKCPKAQIYIAGSDQIWNPLFENGRDPAFFLAFAPDSSYKMSYAASFAISQLPFDVTDFVYKNLCKFDRISVRESTGISLLESIGITTGVRVLDPVFLLERDIWDSIIQPFSLVKEKYILVYDFERSTLIKDITLRIAIENNYKIISIYKNDYSHKVFDLSGPIEFLNLIKNAQMVITNSFHATAFSIIFEKNFYVVGREEKVNSRMRDLLSLFSLCDRYVETSQMEYKDIDYSSIRFLIKEEILKSQRFLKNSFVEASEKINDK